MAAFVGYCIQANGIYWPWPLANPGQENVVTHAMISAAGAPPDQWDAVPTSAKVQIILFIAILEFCGEQAKPHYMRGGKPGEYPKLSQNKNIPHPVPLNLYDPFGWSTNMDEATKERRLLMEINNGGPCPEPQPRSHAAITKKSGLGLAASTREARHPRALLAPCGVHTPHLPAATTPHRPPSAFPPPRCSHHPFLALGPPSRQAALRCWASSASCPPPKASLSPGSTSSPPTPGSTWGCASPP